MKFQFHSYFRRSKGGVVTAFPFVMSPPETGVARG